MIRYPAVAGTFYPAKKEELKRMVEKFLEEAQAEKFRNKPRALLVPHAGYIYSGIVAAFGFKALKGYNFSKVILIGPSHYFPFSGIALDESEKWQTPLGEVDLFYPSETENCGNIFFKEAKIHQPEHCLEVEIPFLQIILKRFKILPMLTGQVKNEEAANCIEKIIDEETLIIISSDLSHYLPYQESKTIDKKTVRYILDNNSQNFEKYGQACGEKAISILLKIARDKNWQASLLSLLNSGDTSGKKDQVVGYSSIVFTEK